MNSNIKITANTSRVGPETENIYNHDFFNSIDFICNALDNIAARLYIDSKVLINKSIIFETLTNRLTIKLII